MSLIESMVEDVVMGLDFWGNACLFYRLPSCGKCSDVGNTAMPQPSTRCLQHW